MVVPIIAGGAILAFITWGEDVFGKKTFKQIMRAGIALGLLIIIYIGYKAYKVWKDAKDKAEDIYEDVTGAIADTYGSIMDKLVEAGERGKSSYKWITEVTPGEFLPDVDAAFGKITPGDYETTYGSEAEKDTSLLRKVYWGPTAVILGTKERVVGETKSIHEDITTVPSQLRDKLDQDISKIAKAKKDLLNAPSYYAEKLKFW